VYTDKTLTVQSLNLDFVLTVSTNNYWHVKFCTETDHKHAYKFCMNTL